MVDPWLVQDLTFFDQGWAYTGKKKVLGPGRLNVSDVASETDLILLSQVGGWSRGAREVGRVLVGQRRQAGGGCVGESGA